MVNLILKIYDYLQSNKWLYILFVLLSLTILVSQSLTLGYKEDIYDFLPVDSKHQNSLEVYQNISSAEKIFIMFQHKDSTIINQDEIVESMECFRELLIESDTLGIDKELTISIDVDNYRDMTYNIYNHIPYFLTKDDFNRLDTLITHQYIKEKVSNIKSLLLLPSGGLLTENIQKDPLNLFTPIVSRLQNYNQTNNYELYDGYIFTPNKKKAIAMLNSPYGSSETANNAILIKYLSSLINGLEKKFPNITVHLTGAPVIAVGNANQIKDDSIIAILFAAISIFGLLLYSFRNFKELIYIAISIIFGWLFAMACISLFRNQISIIVLGISSVFIGIAVNYPLHLISHSNHQNNIRDSLKDIIPPLVVGNITTVGAFLCLVPLKSTALKDLGLFGSFMLIGTILFVIIFLPQIISHKRNQTNNERVLFPHLLSFNFENKKWVFWTLILTTLPLAYFSTHTKFDANMQNINYMTEEQRNDFSELQSTMSNGLNTLYITYEDTTINGALNKCEKKQMSIIKSLVNSNYNYKLSSISNFYPSLEEQNARIKQWNSLIDKKYQLLNRVLKEELNNNGFEEQAFIQFFEIINQSYSVGDIDFSEVLGEISKQYVCELNGHHYIVDKLSIPFDNTEQIKNLIQEQIANISFFDVSSMNNAISKTLSDEFDYIGISCGIIVFLFLWASFGRIELSIMAFLPMAISWIWILGIMGITGIQFNIVNVILATFIFGQGDDYTIFMSEGLIDEYAYKKKLLTSYKNSILMSALIMFLGIGCLIITEHPALHSLAEVTIVGMAVVVLTAYIIPPMVFKFLNFYNNKPRKYSLTLERLITTLCSTIVYLIEIIIGLLLGFVLFTFGNKSMWKRKIFHGYIHYLARINCKYIYGVNISIKNIYNEDFKKGSIIICNHQSILDSLLMMAIYPKLLIVINSKVTNNIFVQKILEYVGYYTTDDSFENYLEDMNKNLKNGFHICVFPEGARSDNKILRFHKEVFYLIEQLKADIIPVIMHGANMVMPKGCAIINRGAILLEVGKRIKYSDTTYGNNYQERTKCFHKMYCKWYSNLSNRIENAVYFRDFVKSRYYYRGLLVEKETSNLLKKYNSFSNWVDQPIDSDIIVVNNGYGVIGLLFSLVHKNKQIYAIETDNDKNLISRHVSCKPQNLHILNDSDIIESIVLKKSKFYLFKPTIEQINAYSNYDIVIIN